jgi:hypothetical protein
MYAPPSQVKAESGAERSFPHKRGRRKRGSGATNRRRERRAMASQRLIESRPLDRVMAKSMKALATIDKLQLRNLKFGLRISLRRRLAQRSLDDIGVRINVVRSQEDGRGKKDVDHDQLRRLKQAYESARMRLSSLRSTEIDFFSGRWGLPRDLTKKRLTHNDLAPHFRALPRVSIEEWSRSRTEFGRQLREEAQAQALTTGKIRQVRECFCSKCRVSVLCPEEHYVDPGKVGCAFCNWTRHDGITSRSRRGENRRRVAKAPSRK